MKKLLAASICAVLFLTPLAHARRSLSDLFQAQRAYIQDSTNANPTILTAQSNVTYTILAYVLSISTADNIYFKCGSTQVTAPLYLGATSGIFQNIYPAYLQCPSGTAFSLVKGTATTPVGITVYYLTDNP